MPREDRATWKSNYFLKIIVSCVCARCISQIKLNFCPLPPRLKYVALFSFQKLLDDYPKCFIVGADNVGSKQMQTIRLSLRDKAVVLMGKNTMMRKAIRGHLENNPALEK